MNQDAPPTEERSFPSVPVWMRWTMLFFVSLAMFGNYYIYDSIAPLADVLKSQLGFRDIDIGWLNAIYSLPNLIFVLIGGILIDRIGARKATLIFSAICVVGAIVTASTGSLNVMASGRLIFGIGAESMIVAVTTALAKWFRGRELGFAFGLNLMIARAGSYAAKTSPGWAESYYETWHQPLWLAAVVGLTCIIGALVYWILETQAEKDFNLGQAAETDKFLWADLFKFSRSFWLIVALCATFYSGIFPFDTFSIKFFMEVHGATRAEGGGISGVLTLFTIFATPIFGLMADRLGGRSKFMIFGCLLLMPVYLILAYTTLSPYAPMMMMGLAFSLVPAMSPKIGAAESRAC